MTKEQLKKEAEVVADWAMTNSIFWYFTEYKNEIDVSDIATIFTKAFHDKIWAEAEDIINTEEN